VKYFTRPEADSLVSVDDRQTGSRASGRIVVVPDRKSDPTNQLRQAIPRRPSHIDGAGGVVALRIIADPGRGGMNPQVLSGPMQIAHLKSKALPIYAKHCLPTAKKYTKRARRPEIDSANPGARIQEEVRRFAFAGERLLSAKSDHPGTGNEFLLEPQIGQKVTAIMPGAKYTETNASPDS
jgi:hypothetical protein